MNSSILQNYKAFCESESNKLMGVLKECNMNELLEQFSGFYKKEIDKAQPEIMVYGIYNSGKSTLINALARKNVAAVGDIPLTDNIDKYVWNGYEITDTPGVDAPIKHEKVTEEHLKHCAVVIFVMSSGGGFENRNNYLRMIDVINAGKRLLLVVNDKADIGEDGTAVSSIQYKVKRNLQVVGEECGVKINDDDYEVIFVNAKQACQGHEYEDEELVASSNLPMLERRILAEIKRTNGYDNARIIVNEIDRVAHAALEELSAQGSDEAIVLNQLKLFLKENKHKVKETISDKLDTSHNSLKDRIAGCITRNTDDQAALEKEMKEISEAYSQDIAMKVEHELNEIIDEMQTTFEKKLDDVENLVFGNNVAVDGEKLNVGGQSADGSDYSFEKNSLNEELSSILQDGAGIATSIGSKIKSGKMAQDAVKKALKTKFAKQVLKKFGLEKAAAKVVPVIGPIITVISIVSDVISVFNERDRRRQEEDLRRAEQAKAEAIARAEIEAERAKAIQKLAEDIAADIVEKMKYAMFDSINKFFSNIMDKVSAETRSAEAEKEQHNKHINKLHEITNACREFCLII